MIIPGRNIIVYIEKDGVYYATACDKSSTLSIQAEFLENTDPGGSYFKSRTPTYVDWALTGDSLVDYNRLISVLFMQQAILSRTRIQVKFFAQNGDGYAIYKGYGYFQEIDETGEVNGVASYTYQIVADGVLSISSTITQNDNKGLLQTVLMTTDNQLIINDNNELIITG